MHMPFPNSVQTSYIKGDYGVSVNLSHLMYTCILVVTQPGVSLQSEQVRVATPQPNSTACSAPPRSRRSPHHSTPPPPPPRPSRERTVTSLPLHVGHCAARFGGRELLDVSWRRFVARVTSRVASSSFSSLLIAALVIVLQYTRPPSRRCPMYASSTSCQ